MAKKGRNQTQGKTIPPPLSKKKASVSWSNKTKEKLPWPGCCSGCWAGCGSIGICFSPTDIKLQQFDDRVLSERSFAMTEEIILRDEEKTISPIVVATPKTEAGEEKHILHADEIKQDITKTDAAQRIAELEAWLLLVKKGGANIWEAMPIPYAQKSDWQLPDGIRLQENSLTPVQQAQPHCIAEDKRVFATDAEYQLYIADSKAWAAAHYPPGVEIVPVVTSDGIKTVALIGLTAQQANTIDTAIQEKIALEKQAALSQAAETLPQVEVPERTQSLLEPGNIKARVERVAAEMKIENANTVHPETTDLAEAEVLSSTPHSLEMQAALRQAMTANTETTTTEGTALTVVHLRTPKAAAVGRTA